MFYTQNRDQLRQFYVDTWAAFRAHKPLDPVGQMLVEVIKDHPEYHAFLEKSKTAHGGEYFPEQGETNPFLHMGMHMALREQVSTDRPQGIRNVFQQLYQKSNDRLEAEHQMMECLAEALHAAQRHNQMPDETAYLQCLNSLL